MGNMASSISGVEKQLEEQEWLHLEFEQRKVRTRSRDEGGMEGRSKAGLPDAKTLAT
jgi:hypothetical protein